MVAWIPKNDGPWKMYFAGLNMAILGIYRYVRFQGFRTLSPVIMEVESDCV